MFRCPEANRLNTVSTTSPLEMKSSSPLCPTLVFRLILVFHFGGGARGRWVERVLGGGGGSLPFLAPLTVSLSLICTFNFLLHS